MSDEDLRQLVKPLNILKLRELVQRCEAQIDWIKAEKRQRIKAIVDSKTLEGNARRLKCKRSVTNEAERREVAHADAELASVHSSIQESILAFQSKQAAEKAEQEQLLEKFKTQR